MNDPHVVGATVTVADVYGVTFDGDVALNQTSYRWRRPSLPDAVTEWPRGSATPFDPPYDFEAALSRSSERFFTMAPSLLVEVIDVVPASLRRSASICVVDRSVQYRVRQDLGLALERAMLLILLMSERSRDMFSLQLAKSAGGDVRIEPPGVTASSDEVHAMFERLEHAWRAILSDGHLLPLLDRPKGLD